MLLSLKCFQYTLDFIAAYQLQTFSFTNFEVADSAFAEP